ncbi:MAG: Ig domain-containing protein [Acidobacteriota bacterium]
MRRDGAFTYAVTAGALPPGLALNGATGVISGTPTTSGTFNFTITATDAGSCTGSLAYTVTINPSGCGTITISPATLPNAVLGMLYSQTLTASGGTAPYTFAVTAGALPAGLTLSAAGVISGTPQVTGPFNCTITATDSASCTGSQIYTLTVVAISDYVVGQGDGQPNANRVRVYTPAGTPTSVDFLAYAAGQWGVNVASGNVNGPIFDEILTGPGPGPVFGPQVRGWDRAGTPLAKINYYAYGTLKFGVNVGSADVENDAFDEILTGAGPGPVFGPHVRGWNYDNVTLTAIAKISFFAYGTLKYGVNVTGGSVDADAFDEIGTGPGPGVIFGPQMRGWNYDGANITAISKVNFNAFAGLTYGLNLAWGDVDGDGFDELIATPGPGPTNPSRFVGYDYDGTTISALPGFDITPFTTMYGGRVGAGDLLGDLSEDLIAGAGPNSVATSETQGYDYTGSALVLVPPTFVPFTGGYGVNVSGGILGY